jgi:hypothetical protein
MDWSRSPAPVHKVVFEMLLGISGIMIVVYTIYFNRVAQAKKPDFQSGLGRCIAMAIGMISGIALGLIVAIQIPQLLAVSTLLSILLSTAVVYFIGKPFGMTGIIDSLSSSLMGAMMGAMLGAMLHSPWTDVMVSAIDAIYLITVISLGLLLTKDHQKNEKKKPIYFLVTLILPLFIIGTVAFLQSNEPIGEKNVMMMKDM